MKLLFIGETDSLAKALVDTFAKEDDSIFIVSKCDFKSNNRPALQYKFYSISSDHLINNEIFMSINPDVIVFAGKYFLISDWDLKNSSDNYLSQLSYWLEKSKTVKKFVYLSSTQVYGDIGQAINEENPINPVSLKGLTMASGEAMVKLYEKQFEIKTSILRCSDIFDYNINVGYNDFLSESVNKLLTNLTIKVSDKEFIQPIHVNDIANAIKRLLQNGLNNKIYNVCSSNVIKKSTMYEILTNKINNKCEIDISIGEGITIDNETLKHDIEWVDFKNFKEFIEEHNFSKYFDIDGLDKNIKSKSELKKFRLFKRFSDFTRKIIEHCIIFIVFCFLIFMTKDNNLFANVDWMVIYLILISLSYGIFHTTIAVVLSSIIYLFNINFDFKEITNFYSYVDIILKVIEYLLIGIFIAYIVEMLKEDIRIKTEENSLLIAEKNEIKDINNKNVLIKNEYEKRLLNTKNSLPKLYSIISKINILQPEKIFYEILHVVSEMMDTSTVAVYTTNINSSYIRLTAALNKESVYNGKSWNLIEDFDIKESIDNGEIYRGDKWQGKPAFVAPVMHRNNCIAVIVIKKMLFENQSLYQVNLLKTLTILISDAVSKAMDYEKNMEANNYIDGTEILIYNEFIKKVSLGYEKQKLNLGNCCVIKCNIDRDDIEKYSLIKSLLRTTDILGLNNNDQICILLGNDSKEDGKYLIERLKNNNIIAEITDEFEYLGE